MTGWFKARWKRMTAQRERGAATAYTIVSVVTMVLVAGLVLDAGLALSAKTKAMDAAQAAARAGASELDVSAYRETGRTSLNAEAAEAVARRWIANAGYTGEVSAAGDQITVTVHTGYDTQLLSLAGLNRIPVSARATATAVRGVTGVEP